MPESTPHSPPLCHYPEWFCSSSSLPFFGRWHCCPPSCSSSKSESHPWFFSFSSPILTQSITKLALSPKSIQICTLPFTYPAPLFPGLLQWILSDLLVSVLAAPHSILLPEATVLFKKVHHIVSLTDLKPFDCLLSRGVIHWSLILVYRALRT